MARIYQTPTREQILNDANDEFKETLNKMIAIQDILLNDPPKDKKFNKRYMDYFIEYSTILFKVESENERYTNTYIQNAINRLYNKIFKNRRY